MSVETRRRARYTIALPVRNGGHYLRECVEGVLAQSCGDFALEILENASADGTAEWLRTLTDSRIRVWPAPQPLSIQANWRRAVDLPKGDFLLFVGHDDRLDPHYLATIDALIRRAPDAALFTTHFRLIDAEGRVIRRCQPMPGRETMAGFLRTRLTFRTDMTAMGVVMRAAAHDALGGIPPFDTLAHADDALWLGLLGGTWKATAPDEAFSFRWHRASAFGSLSWRSAVTAMEQFAHHVERLARTHTELGAVWRQHGPRFLARRYRYIILSATMRQRSEGTRFGPREREEALASLDRLSPPAASRLRRSWRVRLAASVPGGPATAALFACWEAYWRLRWRWTGAALRARAATGGDPGGR